VPIVTAGPAKDDVEMTDADAPPVIGAVVINAVQIAELYPSMWGCPEDGRWL
jgi:hypothetical protein